MDPFKAYDIRGVYPYEVNEDLAYDIGRSLPKLLNAKSLVVGRDMRTSSDSLFDALMRGIRDAGTTIINLGRVSTPQFYFALYTSTHDGGVMITASHNPKEYNGFKICSANAAPVFKDNGLLTLKKFIESHTQKTGMTAGHYIEQDIQDKYLEFFKKKILSTDIKNILIDTGNGMGAYEVATLKKLYPHLNIDVLYENLDGEFPNHECNPIKADQYNVLVEKLQEGNYDFGCAFDGDGDRIAFYTKKGMIPPDLITAVLAPFVAKRGDKVGFEVRSSQVVEGYLKGKGFVPRLYPSGHAYIKEHMKEDHVVFAGEKSGHYFYQHLHFTDSSLYSLMVMMHALSETGKSLQQLIQPLMDAYYNTGELNYKVHDADAVLASIEKDFAQEDIKKIDGVSVYGHDFFFNARKSNTEPLLRINIEANTKKIADDIKERVERLIGRV